VSDTVSATEIDAVLAAQRTLNTWGYDNPAMPRQLSISIELARCLELQPQVQEAA
jgi:hypothetical protein